MPKKKMTKMECAGQNKKMRQIKSPHQISEGAASPFIDTGNGIIKPVTEGKSLVQQGKGPEGTGLKKTDAKKAGKGIDPGKGSLSSGVKDVPGKGPVNKGMKKVKAKKAGEIDPGEGPLATGVKDNAAGKGPINKELTRTSSKLGNSGITEGKGKKGKKGKGKVPPFIKSKKLDESFPVGSQGLKRAQPRIDKASPTKRINRQD